MSRPRRKRAGSRSFTIGLRTFSLGPWNFTFGPWNVSFATVCGGVAALFAVAVLGLGLLHHFVWERETQEKSAAESAYPGPSTFGGQKNSAALGQDSSNAGFAAGSTTDRSTTPLAGAGAADSPKPGESTAASVTQPKETLGGAKADTTSVTVAPPGVTAGPAANPNDITASKGLTADLEPSPMVTEWQDWKRIQHSHKLAHFQAFLQKYPAGPYSPAAAEARQQLQWQAVDKQNPSSLQAYLDKNQQGAFSSEARQRLGALLQAQQARTEEQSAWNSLDPSTEQAIQHPGNISEREPCSCRARIASPPGTTERSARTRAC